MSFNSLLTEPGLSLLSAAIPSPSLRYICAAVAAGLSASGGVPGFLGPGGVRAGSQAGAPILRSRGAIALLRRSSWLLQLVSGRRPGCPVVCLRSYPLICGRLDQLNAQHKSSEQLACLTKQNAVL
jgi:hypothetical protein